MSTFMYTANGSAISNSPIANHIYATAGTYTVTLILTSALGTVTNTRDITIYPKPIINPIVSLKQCDYISPNNDGTNDYFQLLFFGGIKTFNCTILNRWGQVVREYDNPAFMWDGKDESGEDVLEGVYFYIAKAVSNGGNEIMKHGNVTLVRSE